MNETTELLYKKTDYHNPEAEMSIAWDDKDIATEWTFDEEPILSDNDKLAKKLINI